MKLTIKGKEYGTHWGLGAFESASDIYGINENDLFLDSILREVVRDDEGAITSVGEEFGVSKQALLGAVVNWCDENNETVEFTPKQFTNFYNDLTQADRDGILVEFKKSIYNGKTVESIFDDILKLYSATSEEVEAKVVKKKATTRKSLKVV